jgi:signal transduction histidine kinase/ligand-binding sensor domain-containing protein/DNA-binding response OmpR family regulator
MRRVVKIRRAGLLVALTAALALSATAHANGTTPLFEPPRFARFGIAAGLSQSSVTAIAQDRRGFLWLGTRDGLNRFDGYEFRTYRPDPEDPSALDDGAITALAAHADGSLWVGTHNGGLARYDPASDTFLVVRAGGSALPSDRITALAIDASGAVWIGTDAGLARSAPRQDGRPGIERMGDVPVSSLVAAGDGRLWSGHETGELVAYADGAVSARVAVTSRSVRALVADDAGLWVAEDGPVLHRVDARGVLLTRYGLVAERGTTPRLRALERGVDGRLWIGGLALGVVVLDPRTGTMTSMRHRALDPQSLSHDDVVSLFRDRADSLWIGTLSGGLNRLRLRPTGFAHHWHQPGNPASLSHNTVTSFAEADDGRIFVGTDGGGLDEFDPVRGTFERTDAPITRAWSLWVDARGALWAGTWGAGLYRRAPGRKEFTSVGALGSAVVTSFAEDRDSLWVGTADRGLYRLSAAGDVRQQGLDGVNVTALHADAAGRLYVGTFDSGLFVLSADGAEIDRFRYVSGDAASLPGDSVRSLAIDSAGSVWVATNGGLARLDAGERRFERHGEAQGIPTGTVYAVEIDESGRAWLGTNAGLVRFDPVRGTARLFTPEEGAQDFEFNGDASLRLRDGRLLFGGLNGFNLVDPQLVPPAPDPGRVEIVGILLANRPMVAQARDPTSPLSRDATELEALTLGHRDDVLSIRFVAPLPDAAYQQLYEYRLDPFESAWQPADARRRLSTYTNLPAGRYVFRARTGNADGLWSSTERTLALRLRPPWWAAAWAYALYALTGLLALAAFIQWRTRALRIRAQTLQAMVEQRTAQLAQQTRVIEDQARHLQHALESKERLFARVSHEFRTPLTLIVGPIDALLADERRGRTAAWLRLMRRNARRLLSLVDQLLGLARLSGEAPLQTSPQHVTATVRATVAAFDSSAISKGVSLGTGRLDEAWALATPEFLERMVTNLVSNAVTYTPRGGHVQASVENEGELISIVVADDGPGIPPEEHAAIFEPFHRVGEEGAGTGIGLALVRESAEALGGSVMVDSAPGRGARFSIRLPACAAPRGDAGADATPTERMLLESEVAAESAVDVDDHALAESLSSSAAAGDDRPRILIAEDNADLRVLLLAALAPDFRCATASDGRAGVAAAIDDPPDLVVSDVMMPEMDGFELTRALKQDPRTSHVPIVLLTALGDRDSRLQGLEEHADDYLVKPFDADELRLRVRNFIEARRIAGRRAARGLYDEARPIASTAAADPVSHSPRERAFLERLRGAAERGHADAAFGVAQLASQVAMSERQLQRKLRALLDVAPADYLREFRLQRAAALVREGHPAGNVAFDVGFSTPSHFGACFKARFGTTPGEYAAGS